jgi:methylenetetrahydrofolate reductase (NADPH)
VKAGNPAPCKLSEKHKSGTGYRPRLPCRIPLPIVPTMRIRDLFRPNWPLFSIELFPPKTPAGIDALKAKLVEIRAHEPDFISVTYGAAGGTRTTTREICAHIKRDLGMEAMAHLTCAAHTRAEIGSLLDALHADGIHNIMALRGDAPPGETFHPQRDGYPHAIDLVRALRADGRFGIGVAGYPEGHVEAPDYATDLKRQIDKMHAGADFAVSQFFLETRHFLRWRDDVRRAGVTIPLLAGILPALSADQIARFAKLCGATVPQRLMAGLTRFDGHPDSAAAFGLVYALQQVEQLLEAGVDGIHLYALNRLESIRAVSALVRGLRPG